MPMFLIVGILVLASLVLVVAGFVALATASRHRSDR
jgi:hypothetical protein